MRKNEKILIIYEKSKNIFNLDFSKLKSLFKKLKVFYVSLVEIKNKRGFEKKLLSNYNFYLFLTLKNAQKYVQ